MGGIMIIKDSCFKSFVLINQFLFSIINLENSLKLIFIEVKSARTIISIKLLFKIQTGSRQYFLSYRLLTACLVKKVVTLFL